MSKLAIDHTPRRRRWAHLSRDTDAVAGSPPPC
jgi:hypothetical protein